MDAVPEEALEKRKDIMLVLTFYLTPGFTFLALEHGGALPLVVGGFFLRTTLLLEIMYSEMGLGLKVFSLKGLEPEDSGFYRDLDSSLKATYELGGDETTSTLWKEQLSLKT